jgi:hypothetical protein
MRLRKSNFDAVIAPPSNGSPVAYCNRGRRAAGGARAVIG